MCQPFFGTPILRSHYIQLLGVAVSWASSPWEPQAELSSALRSPKKSGQPWSPCGPLRMDPRMLHGHHLLNWPLRVRTDRFFLDPMFFAWLRTINDIDSHVCNDKYVHVTSHCAFLFLSFYLSIMCFFFCVICICMYVEHCKVMQWMCLIWYNAV